MSKHVFFVTCPKGVEYLLADEMETFGLHLVRNAPAGVWVEGSLESGYRACLWSRLANRVILNVADVDARHADELYDGVVSLDWQVHIPAGGSFRVTFLGQNETIRNTQFGAQKVKDGIVDSIRGAGAPRPSVAPKDPDVTVSARLNRGRLSLGIDLSGHSLHMRGYRTDKGVAPLKENLAAALLIRAGWPEVVATGGDFVDPMCGSGTLLIEAALMALDIAPGRKQERFGFEKWPGHQPDLWLGLRQEAERRAHEGKQKRVPRFFGSDHDERVIATAWKNIQRAGLEDIVQVEARPVHSFRRQEGLSDVGLVLTNPPYGERLSDRKELAVLYQALGESIIRELPGWRLGVFTGAPEFGKSLGLRSFKQYKLFNGKLPAQLLLFEVLAENAMTPRDPAAPGEIMPRIANPERAAMLRNRLKKNLKTIGQWARKQGIGCYRLYDADMPEYALAIDIYEGQVHVQEYAAPKSVDERAARERLAEALSVIPEVLELEPGMLVCKQRQRQAGSRQYEKQAATGDYFNVHEHGCLLRVNLKDYLDTGLFLDHRPVRHWIQQNARGKRFLNLFCYTGAASVHAAVGGASRSLSLDMSKTYVAWAKENLALNGADSGRHRVEQADCLAWLADRKTVDQRFDLIFMDPPTFSNSARMSGVLDIQRDHGALIRQCMARLSSEGLLIFSNNFRKFRLDESLESEFEVQEVSGSTLDKDFQRNPKIHRCWHIRHQNS
ncbi:bifunctional 23S rRNA (guanine(2069)-N(7))-methyltransferase RlmK/23S rRNA (guanine(2445)-N(2))-methyltransferase RlmL [Marinobacter daepoensis]|uniref:Ribosomal RNA large subunit methyltransferase K/L n=1 Tax=Marinobacter daepoensis TaxID=262077 RepID=A0ABS3BBU4_9GAMM|nr:bifunctional 23S rRNA (guanine(2069)-N(7))-methyltransferase RlmK/23S rRNA (guanine(2445)-N(2))-methyltransferase RlmL [Marinobacter daepoensis]MBN7769321.1 bifunctional 23S rRNA (guanine(2069)-N(7))-methyltransferase RlmK/23S rRNA (guanine(2445)-N(2))-methyltransferase RlmL [Marinobacter daepoensis]MBY6078011.1 bifunctional 23S rRNA (guanine(2069)-N(7))-methyltransferase RlmK/23S rRNA (guanine(2445)-N(2))-methyltransferase RlmL [Marinobacter daepoensis]